MKTLLALVGIVVVGGAAYYYYQYKNLPPVSALISTEKPFGLNSIQEAFILYSALNSLESATDTLATLNADIFNPAGYSVTALVQTSGANSVPYTIINTATNTVIPYPFNIAH